ncbi:hypothetical protein TRICI_001671 [Trichomonascus ciferrii]|uniref:Uncharacterized protein n=1 Tax=Trichomonascus ciferrii TaxID=44093 RepID=A0A642V7V8_9ASCO|nr:hypothetical protein TRICI_001671 [Trichomonascus ciferrii]
MVLFILGLLLFSALGRAVDTPLNQTVRKPNFRLFGGNGPYATHELMGIDPSVPGGCQVEQVVMLSRHAGRYPVSFQSSQYERTIRKIQHMRQLSGPLEFIKTYQMFMNSSDQGQLTSTGPFNGALQARMLGEQFRSKYSSLWYSNSTTKLNLLASKSDRVIETCELFAKGFFANDTSKFTVVQIPEIGGGVNSLTPEYSCIHRYDLLSAMFKGQEFLDSSFQHIVDRFKNYTQPLALPLDSNDIVSLMSLCPFELSTKARSQFCNLFDDEDWKAFDYYNSLIQYYSFGPNTNASRAAGSVFTNATLALLKQGPEEMGPLYFNFAHDIDVIAALGSLGLFLPDSDLPTDHTPIENPFQLGQLTPMLAHLVFERISCQNSPTPYIRLLINDAPIPVPKCQSGPGRTCPISDFENYVNQHFTSFQDVCGTSPFQKDYFDLFWEYKNK